MSWSEDPTPCVESLVADGSELSALIRATDWSKTPIGPVETWSLSLRMTVGFLLANRFPLLLWWGPQYISIYNDAYRPVLGTKHPVSMGQPVRECWSEIWHVLKPLIDTPFNGGPATWMDDILLEINRHGFIEETHYTIAYSPVPDETAPRGIGGVLATVNEITEKVVGERRVAALGDLGTRTGEAKTAREACAIAAENLADHVLDVPFALLYLIDPDGKQARLAGSTGLGMNEAMSPLVVALGTGTKHDSGWPLAEAVRREAMITVEDLAVRFGSAPPGPWSDPPNQAVVVPLRSNKAHQLAGLLVAGVSSRLRLDDGYRAFFELAAAQIATAIATAQTHEEERKRAEALAEIDRAKTLFFSNVSHEFRTPLALMLGPLEDLLAKPASQVSPDDHGLLKVAHRNGLRLLKLVNSLLDFSRIEAGRLEACYEPVDLAQLTAELASNFRSACEKAGLVLDVACPPIGEPVHVDRDMWEKIVLNLLSNALKFTFVGGIMVALRRSGNYVVLSIRDSGIGVPEQERLRLFDRFHRVDGARGRTREGTGIGLALVKELVKLHGGTVQVDSAIGRGSTFTVTLPLGTAHLPQDRLRVTSTPTSKPFGAHPYVDEALRWLPPEQDAAPASGVEHACLPEQAQAASRTRGERATILFADDNADMRDYVCHLLSARYDVRTVADGAAALVALRESRPDLVLSDVMIPRLDGFGLLRAVRADAALADLPIILLSARAGEEASIEGLKAGADDYLIKPFSARELIARIAANLEMARLRFQHRQAEESARVADERLRAALLASGTGTFRWDITTDRVECYESLNRLFGFASGQTSRPLYEFLLRIHPDHRGPFIRKLEGCRREGLDFEMEFQVVRPDGDVVWLYDRGKTFRDAKGRPRYITGACVDITDRKRAEAALRDSEERFRQFAAHSTDVLWLVDVETSRQEFVSPAFERVWGRPIEAGWGPSRWIETVHPEDREGAAEQFDRMLEGEDIALEYRIIRPDGGVRWIRERIFPIRDAQGRVRRIGGSARDITNHSESLVYLVDADEASRRCVASLLQRAGYDVKPFASARTFLDVAPALVAGCVVIDIRSPTIGLAVPQELKARRIQLPVIVLGDARDDVGLGVRAMKAGAADFLHAPCERETLLTAVATALADIRQRAERDRAAERARARIAQMSARERQVLDRMLLGGTNKSIARELGLSPRTVEIHRAHAMERLGARTLPEAVLLAVAGGLMPPRAAGSRAPSEEPEAECECTKRRLPRPSRNARLLRGPLGN